MISKTYTFTEFDQSKLSERRNRAIQPFVDAHRWVVFTSPEEFEQSYNKQWVTGEVRFDGYPVDFSLASRPESRRLAVVFNSQQKDDGNLRLFTWQNAAKLLDCSRLHISDPTLSISDTALIGWYTANKYFNSQKAVSRLIDIVVNTLAPEKIIFLGSSGGGFPAAYEGCRIKNSICVLLAPTFQIRNSPQAKKGKTFFTELHDLDTFPEVEASFNEVDWSILKSIDRANYDLKFHILQSTGDDVFWEGQLSPLLENFGFRFKSRPDYLGWQRSSLRLGNWGTKHTPPPAEVLNSELLRIRNIPIGELASFRLQVGS